MRKYPDITETDVRLAMEKIVLSQKQFLRYEDDVFNSLATGSDNKISYIERKWDISQHNLSTFYCSFPSEQKVCDSILVFIGGGPALMDDILRIISTTERANQSADIGQIFMGNTSKNSPKMREWENKWPDYEGSIIKCYMVHIKKKKTTETTNLVRFILRELQSLTK